MTAERFTVEDRPAESRYVLLDHEASAVVDSIEADAASGASTAPDPVIGEEQYLDVLGDSGRTERVLIHTGVDDGYAGQGLASFLVRTVVDDVIARGFAIVPVCPYVRAWLPKHPEYAAHVVPRRPGHLAAIRARG